MDEGVNNPDINELITALNTKLDATTAELMERVSGVDAEFLFQILAMQSILRNSSGKEESANGSNPAQLEAAAYLLYPEFGKSSEREPAEVQTCLDLFENYFRLETMAAGFHQSDDSDLARIQAWLRMHELTIRGEAYASHTRELIDGIHGRFSSWFEHHVGVSPKRALHICDIYEQKLNENAAASQAPLYDMKAIHAEFLKIFAESGQEAAETYMLQPDIRERGETFYNALNILPAYLAVSYNQIRESDDTITTVEWDGLKNLIGMTYENRKLMTHRREVRRNPLYCLSGDRIICADLSMVYEALFNGFENSIKSDSKKRDDYDRHMSTWMEQQVAEFLLRVFPKDNVYTQVTYPDPDNVGGEAELDVAVVWGPYLLIIEVKGKQFRDSARWGDRTHLFTDLKKNVQEAFDQTQRAAKYILQVDFASFKEKATNRRLQISKSTLKKLFAVSVTLRDFRGLMTHIAKLSEVGLFKGSEYPWSVSLNDLNIITNFLQNPDAFVHFIKRRIEMQQAKGFINGDEIDLLSNYLQNRLDPGEFWETRDKDGDAFDFLMIAPCSEDIDQWYAIEQGSKKGKKPFIGLKIPKCLETALSTLKSRGSDDDRFIAMKLLDLPNPLLAKMDKMVNAFVASSRRGRLERATVVHDGVPVTMLLGDWFSPIKAVEVLKNRVLVESYRNKSDTGIGLYFDVNGTVAFHTGIVLTKKWEQDALLDKFIADEILCLAAGAKPPVTYGPCPCGSDKKFKFCCKPKMRKQT